MKIRPLIPKLLRHILYLKHKQTFLFIQIYVQTSIAQVKANMHMVSDLRTDGQSELQKQLGCLQTSQCAHTICPGSSDPLYIATLLYKKGHYFLDILYMVLACRASSPVTPVSSSSCAANSPFLRSSSTHQIHVYGDISQTYYQNAIDHLGFWLRNLRLLVTLTFIKMADLRQC